VGVGAGRGSAASAGAGASANTEDDEQADAAAKARRSVRTNNFTQQTNALDVDKHMYARPCHFFTFIFGRVLYADRAAFQDGVH
jgi:hypothetical protein